MSAALAQFPISAGRNSAGKAARFYRHVFPRGFPFQFPAGGPKSLRKHGRCPSSSQASSVPMFSMFHDGRPSMFGHHLAPVRALISRIGVLFGLGLRTTSLSGLPRLKSIHWIDFPRLTARTVWEGSG